MSYRASAVFLVWGCATLLAVPASAGGKPNGQEPSEIDRLASLVAALEQEVQGLQAEVVELQGTASTLQDRQENIDGTITVIQDLLLTSKKKLVFVTSGSWTGNLGGLDGADAKCQTAAIAAGIPGTFYAWLSTAPGPEVGHPSSGPLQRFTRHPTPYVRPDGVKVADHFGDLVDGTLDNPINVTETLTALFAGNLTWSSTSADGTPTGGAPFSSTCDNWTTDEIFSTATFSGSVGATDFFWSAPGLSVFEPCSNSYRLVCVEQ